ncbi:MAG: hypothetical protein XD98_0107 [Microgenomates bacterium 39_6]|nr:MAG: hypothetical protein XD98_0107 [Microgenomates bacterium 39_6]
MIIGLLGSTLWIVRKVTLPHLTGKLSSIMKTIIPDWHLFWYFAVAFLYNYERVFMYTPRETLWEEPMELLLITGITFFFVQRYVEECKNFPFVNM